ncbi:hypothetical protein [Candidatus Nitrososphaera sp. FF02]|uniref:hypothetical protein n=1 Tax=Candidatus Nitrososphaera sp. FF02 TaxID=3398226 RepID=UPI0039E98EA2
MEAEPLVAVDIDEFDRAALVQVKALETALRAFSTPIISMKGLVTIFYKSMSR